MLTKLKAHLLIAKKPGCDKVRKVEERQTFGRYQEERLEMFL